MGSRPLSMPTWCHLASDRRSEAAREELLSLEIRVLVFSSVDLSDVDVLGASANKELHKRVTRLLKEINQRVRKPSRGGASFFHKEYTGRV
ncbi:hypothetical protein ACLOJK_039567 [Asimina triloba]